MKTSPSDGLQGAQAPLIESGNQLRGTFVRALAFILACAGGGGGGPAARGPAAWQTATQREVSGPSGIVLNSNGNLYVSGFNEAY